MNGRRAKLIRRMEEQSMVVVTIPQSRWFTVLYRFRCLWAWIMRRNRPRWPSTVVPLVQARELRRVPMEKLRQMQRDIPVLVRNACQARKWMRPAGGAA